MSKVSAILKFLAAVSEQLGIAEHLYVVGGAVRNFLMGLDPKDQDLVLDSLQLSHGQDSGWFARALQARIPAGTNLTTNQYGVAILTIKESWILDGHEMRGEVLEIANARRESYGKASGKGYKPDTVEPASIREDLERRDFTVNTLLWRMSSLHDGLASAEVLDLTGQGLEDLRNRTLRTPCAPDRTFTDDPTRMLRAVKFAMRYDLHIHPDTVNSIARNTMALLKMPWDAVRKILVDDILLGAKPRYGFRLLKMLGLNEPLLQLIQQESGFHSGVSRGLNGIDPLLALDLWDAGWRLKGALAGLVNEEDVPHLRSILEGFPERDLFVQALVRPPIDQEALFQRLNLLGPARAQVAKKAREALLDEPALALNPKALEARIETLLQG